MSRLHVTTKAHQWMNQIENPESIVVDATAGNGNDTLFLSKLAKEVFASISYFLRTPTEIAVLDNEE